ncbi:hypothetical protein CLAFUW4_11797 [Fulvia fulva]|uniref:Uncharacterized protein n=1 Tax=Passalora fulva TaxID=5499 RepID=A0A9Q8PEL5_PASFU|nr:uncharacterized protein CLAFUR5_10840 [Fulvia fulva]KAK4617479.1 hypothetical protein CLAFUR4_11802 [Fulvia fulva]KAK4619218.1 hypothetical protein CLAFUR0_11815 [Fulvia fulva]UJO21081.1 hypothetical protein CLAFUR5_10840 [Fulvia fulva]WPV18067.1 hypothetical protein CLAFUW4_11797 [Fulvia fulva]WPV33020.1 hypothetical protein CLAFUW7_11804 [Fulvia fulva]
MRCLDHSHLRLSRLELGTEDETDEVWTLPITELTANDIQLFTWVLSSMQSVKLSLWASMPTDGVSRHAISDKEPLMMLLRGLEASATLKHLSVNFRHGRVWNSTYIGLDRLHFPQLESLRWSGSYAMHFELTELANFITTHRPTLKHFELGLARVVNEGCIVSKKLFEKGIACNLRKFTGAGDIVVSADTEQDWLWCNVPPDQD